jgi:hypothetical protein
MSVMGGYQPSLNCGLISTPEISLVNAAKLISGSDLLNLSSLVDFANSLNPLYVHLQSDNKNLVHVDSDMVPRGSDALIDFHSEHFSLILDKYITTSIPSDSLGFILESKGFPNYHAELDIYSPYWYFICDNDNELSESCIPHIVGDSKNPYVRFSSIKMAAGKQVSKLKELAGVGVCSSLPNSSLAPVFNFVTLTFPKKLELLLMDPSYRARAEYKVSKNGKKTSQLDIKPYNILDRMDLCFSEFLNEYSDLVGVPEGSQLGGSASFHPWSSNFPLLPHPHYHLLVSHFCYSKISKSERAAVEDLLISEYRDLKECFGFYTYYNSKSGSCSLRVEDYDKDKPKPDVTRRIKSYIKEPDMYEACFDDVSRCLADLLNFKTLPWGGSHVDNYGDVKMFPLDSDIVRKLWTRIVCEEFSDILGRPAADSDSLFVVHVQYIKATDYGKLVHRLRYKSRPSVLDLDIMFKKASNYKFVDLKGLTPDSLDFNHNTVLSYLYMLLNRFKKENDPFLFNRIESYISKFTDLVDLYPDSYFIEWLQFLSTAKTKTRTFGFWRNIKRYGVSPVVEPLPVIHEDICPICGGVRSKLSRACDSPMFDSVIFDCNSSLFLFDFSNLLGRPPECCS